METDLRRYEQFCGNPPRWWHDAVRQNLPGNMYSPFKFVTFTERAENGVFYRIISLTAFDPAANAPAGIYIDTNIPLETFKKDKSLIDPAVLSFKQLIKSRLPIEKEFIQIPPEINPKMADSNMEVDLRGSARIGIFGQKPDGNLIFYVKQVTLENLRNAVIKA